MVEAPQSEFFRPDRAAGNAIRGAAAGSRIFSIAISDSIHHRIVFGMQRLDQIRNRRAAAQDADGPRGVGSRVRSRRRRRASLPSAAITSGRTST